MICDHFYHSFNPRYCIFSSDWYTLVICTILTCKCFSWIKIPRFKFLKYIRPCVIHFQFKICSPILDLTLKKRKKQKTKEVVKQNLHRKIHVLNKLKKTWLNHLFRNVTLCTSDPQNYRSSDGFFWQSVAIKSLATLKISDKAWPEILPGKALKRIPDLKSYLFRKR